jgi:hypothetical protein
MFRRADPEGDGVASVAERSLALAETFVAKRLHRRVVEAFRFCDVADADGDVVDHSLLLC